MTPHGGGGWWLTLLGYGAVPAALVSGAWGWWARRRPGRVEVQEGEAKVILTQSEAISRMWEHISALHARDEAQQDMIDALRASVRDKEQQIGRLVTRIRELELELAQATAQAAALDVELRRVKAEKAELEREVAALTARMEGGEA